MRTLAGTSQAAPKQLHQQCQSNRRHRWRNLDVVDGALLRAGSSPERPSVTRQFSGYQTRQSTVCQSDKSSHYAGTGEDIACYLFFRASNSFGSHRTIRGKPGHEVLHVCVTKAFSGRRETAAPPCSTPTITQRLAAASHILYRSRIILVWVWL